MSASLINRFSIYKNFITFEKLTESNISSFARIFEEYMEIANMCCSYPIILKRKIIKTI